MYVLLLITTASINTLTVQLLDTFDDLQSCQTAAVQQLAITRVLQKSPKMQFRCERELKN
jgi:hypothetical protein